MDVVGADRELSGGIYGLAYASMSDLMQTSTGLKRMVVNAQTNRDSGKHMSTIMLHRKAYNIQKRYLVELELFVDDLTLLNNIYYVTSDVSEHDLETFLSYIQGRDVHITERNCRGMMALCDEFGCTNLTSVFEQFVSSNDPLSRQRRRTYGRNARMSLERIV